MATQEEILYTTKYGTYYNPATKHYNNKPFTNVICDRCKRENLKSCIGHNNCDLCLRCVDEINSNSYLPNSPFPNSPFPNSPFPISYLPTSPFPDTDIHSKTTCFSVPTDY